MKTGPLFLVRSALLVVTSLLGGSLAVNSHTMVQSQSKFKVSRREVLQMIELSTTRMMEDIPLRHWLGDTEVIGKVNQSTGFTEFYLQLASNSSHDNLVGILNGSKDAGKSERLLYVQPLDTEEMSVILMWTDRLKPMKTKRVYVGLRRHTRKKDVYFLTMIYVRAKGSRGANCHPGYLHEPVCFEFDTWDDRAAPKQSYKYFGHGDCSTSVFSTCRFNASILERMLKNQTQRTEGLSDLVYKNRSADHHPARPHLRTHIQTDKVPGMGTDTTFSIMFDLDINRTEGRFIRHAIRDLSIIADPGKLLAVALYGEHQRRHTSGERHKGQVFRWLFNLTREEEAKGVEEYYKQMKAIKAHTKKDGESVAKTVKLLLQDIERAPQFYAERDKVLSQLTELLGDDGEFPELSQTLRDPKTRDKFLAKPNATQLLERYNQLKGVRFNFSTELPAGVSPWTSSEIVNRVMEEAVEHHPPVTYQLGHILVDAVPRLSSQELEAVGREDLVANEVVQSVLSSSSDIFTMPGWKMQAYANITSLSCMLAKLHVDRHNATLKNEKHDVRQKMTKCDYFMDDVGFRPGALKWIEHVDFFGFGSCKFSKFKTNWNIPNDTDHWETHRNFAWVQMKLSSYAKVLRVHCTPHALKYWRTMIREGFLQRNYTAFRIPFRMKRTPKQNRMGTRMLCAALEFQSFTEIYQKRRHQAWRGQSAITPISGISRSIDLLLEMSMDYIWKARQFDVHFFKLCRSFVLTLRTIMVRLVQDQEILHLWCPPPVREQCGFELHNNHKDRVAVNSVIQFLLHGLGPLEMNKRLNPLPLYRQFYLRNAHEIESLTEYYDP